MTLGTSCLVRNVERRVAINTDPDPAVHRYHSIYGNSFSSASEEEILSACSVPKMPRKSNILAMAAPSCGSGRYTIGEMNTILRVTCAGYAAARIETLRSVLETEGEDAAVAKAASMTTTIHTGLWGCGVFGGNPQVMVALQLLAARMVGIDRVVLYCPVAGRIAEVAEGVRVYEEIVRVESGKTVDILTALESKGFSWGVGTGE